MERSEEESKRNAAIKAAVVVVNETKIDLVIEDQGIVFSIVGGLNINFKEN